MPCRLCRLRRSDLKIPSPNRFKDRSVIRGVLFDAGGTLIEPRKPVGEIYATIAAEFGQVVDPEQLQDNFHRYFPLQPGLAFPPGLPLVQLQQLEMGWWRNLVRDVFADQGPFPQFEPFFIRLYHSFESADLWRLIDGVVPTLEVLGQRGLILAIASNFDSRLFAILQNLELSRYFRTVRISSMCGNAKPAPQLFKSVLQELGLKPEESVHIGDSWREDIQGALGVGMIPVLLDRHRRFIDNPSLTDGQIIRIERFEDLAEIELLQHSINDRQ